MVSDQADEIDSCKRCAEELQVYFKHCEPEAVATAATQWRPFAMVVSESFLDSNLEQLAREVDATLIALPTNADLQELEHSLLPQLKQVFDKHFA